MFTYIAINKNTVNFYDTSIIRNDNFYFILFYVKIISSNCNTDDNE